MKPFIIDIETVPIDMNTYFEMEEEEQLKKLNPIDSKIVAIGVRVDGKNDILMGDEVNVLKSFWDLWKSHKMGYKMVGFNIRNFDIPFMVTRSFILGVVIEPFVIKDILDLRDNINAFRYGHTRGKMKELAVFLGMEIMDIDGSDVATLFTEQKFDKISAYLEKDLEIIETLYERAQRTNIDKISKW